VKSSLFGLVKVVPHLVVVAVPLQCSGQTCLTLCSPPQVAAAVQTAVAERWADLPTAALVVQQLVLMVLVCTTHCGDTRTREQVVRQREAESAVLQSVGCRAAKNMVE
jgi:hypothetical protein